MIRMNHIKKADKKRRKGWIIDNIKYDTIREAKLKTGISQSTIIKYVDINTRIFDIKSYRYACEIARVTPKV